ncbi:hypothetical protein [Nocardiopsis sp. CC223A]|uniref:hypothetical protein n=1 Tax=Nocardiopsis sp. CC223A TaxID=3044051 RepID=UPI00278BC55B|nr:hypothetical protein [Nocardiopsis sp. CC223A]
MGVSLYYSATRDAPLTADERATVDRLVAEGERSLREEALELFPTWYEAGEVPLEYRSPAEVFEGLSLYDDRHLSDGQVLAGSSKMPPPACGVEPLLAQLRHYLDALTRMRRALPGARWHVHIDDAEIPWTEDGYTLGDGTP